ncbi:MAG: cysteine--tRNA ligase [Chloroflexi bacterium]|nr:cysteine--tRNA ligase [Chloroflexota bacterium]MDA1146821.1 cysteine--tRNA ligase [Chloroflexota bacterium]MQC82435.1 cysteine--tRNA ligase [Chloroflexota bacterium]
MKLMDTMTREVRAIEPVQSGSIGIYVCGVTPYADAHVGHAMSLIVYDVLTRYLRWDGNPAGGYTVTFVTNYTDVDDKLIDRAAELNRDALELASENIARWEAEQIELGIAPPNERPRVTGEIDTIVTTIARIIEQGYAYATAEGDVYYRVRNKDDYGKLSHRNIEDLRSGTRGEPGDGKEFALDFSLWKSQKPGEPAWPSPWSDGRPGWHIECSAMAQRYLGDTFEIHGGGVDLIFPHHENEIAQAEAATGQTFARLWMHNGMVQFEGEKMSKSLGNVVTVSDALSRWRPDALRLFVLNSYYRGPNNLTEEAMGAATRGIERIEGALEPFAAAAAASALDAGDTRARFIEAMENDLGTPAAVAALFDLARAINRGRDAAEDVAAAQRELRELAAVLGLRLEGGASAEGLDAGALAKLAAELGVIGGGAEAGSQIEALLERRAAARAERDFALSDRIRDELAGLSVILEDTSEGTRWSVGG